MAALRQGRGGMPEYLAVSWAQRMQTRLPQGRPGRPGSASPLPRTRTRFTVSGTVREQDHGCEGVAAMAVKKTVPAAKRAAAMAPAERAAKKAAARKAVAKKSATTATATTATKAPVKAPVKKAATAVKKGATRKPAVAKPAARTAARKAPAKKTAAKKAPAAKAPARKAPVKKAAAKKAPATKTAVGKAPVKKAVARKAPARKPAAKKAVAQPSVPKKTGARKVAAKKTAAGTAATSGSASGSAVPAACTAAGPGELPVLPGEDPWTPQEVAEARSELLAEVERLKVEIASSEAAVAGLMRDSGDGAGDEADTGSKNITREYELALAANTREMLGQADHALQRLDEGTYGLCEVGGKPIGKARMQAFPRATLCLDDKQRQERR